MKELKVELSLWRRLSHTKELNDMLGRDNEILVTAIHGLQDERKQLIVDRGDASSLYDINDSITCAWCMDWSQSRIQCNGCYGIFHIVHHRRHSN